MRAAGAAAASLALCAVGLPDDAGDERAARPLGQKLVDQKAAHGQPTNPDVGRRRHQHRARRERHRRRRRAAQHRHAGAGQRADRDRGHRRPRQGGLPQRRRRARGLARLRSSLLGKGEDAFWVNNQITATAHPGQVQARVGAAKAQGARAAAELRLSGVALQSDSGSVFAKGTIVNRSKVVQKRLTIFCVARKGAKVVAAGRGILDPPAGRRRQAHELHHLLHRQPEGREAQLLSAPDRPGVAMATTQDIHAPTLGAEGEPCATCGAPLAGDQRYCLDCGARRTEARVAFRDILAAGAGRAPDDGARAPAPVAGAGGPAGAQRRWPSSAGCCACCSALGVGVLIGHCRATTPPAPRRAAAGHHGQRCRRPAGAPRRRRPRRPPRPPRTSTRAARRPSRARAQRRPSTAAGKAATNKKPRTSNSSSGADYQKKSQKLPKQVGTAGKPAPKDNKPAGGGSDFQDIG